MHMDIDTNMKMIGKRIPYYATFTVSCILIFPTPPLGTLFWLSVCHLQVGCTEDGLINGIEATVYNDCGWCNNDNAMGMALDHIDNGQAVSHHWCKF